MEVELAMTTTNILACTNSCWNDNEEKELQIVRTFFLWRDKSVGKR